MPEFLSKMKRKGYLGESQRRLQAAEDRAQANRESNRSGVTSNVSDSTYDTDHDGVADESVWEHRKRLRARHEK